MVTVLLYCAHPACRQTGGVLKFSTVFAARSARFHKWCLLICFQYFLYFSLFVQSTMACLTPRAVHQTTALMRICFGGVLVGLFGCKTNEKSPIVWSFSVHNSFSEKQYQVTRSGHEVLRLVLSSAGEAAQRFHCATEDAQRSQYISIS